MTNGHQEPRGGTEQYREFVALSKFRVANHMAPEAKLAFQRRPHLVDSVAGFVRLDVICPLDCPQEIWLITYWTDEASFRAWHASDEHRQSHAAMPKGLKLDPAATELRFFEYIAS